LSSEARARQLIMASVCLPCHDCCNNKSRADAPAGETGARGQEPPAFDVITANPPYIPDAAEVAPEVMHEPKMALRGGADGLGFIRRIIADAPRFLAPGGALVMEFGLDQGPAVRELLEAGGAFDAPTVLRDHHEIERSVVALRKA
jgi:methylase of polypeptide subunit release factors